MQTLTAFLEEPAERVAPRLLGWRLRRIIDGHLLEGMIVETEAYTQEDAASHSYKGKMPRSEIMFGPPARSYVYFTYGMHHCFNAVTGPSGVGSAVLIRALEPTKGIGIMRTFRRADDINIANGPAKLCQALQIDKRLNGHYLTEEPLQLLPPKTPIAKQNIVTATRIGISKDTHRFWRFFIRGNPFVSRV